jgi:hypothetical protein
MKYVVGALWFNIVGFAFVDEQLIGLSCLYTSFTYYNMWGLTRGLTIKHREAVSNY